MVSFAVTPYGGVWIEIHVLVSVYLYGLSRLMEACGLKCPFEKCKLVQYKSRLMEACGLKWLQFVQEHALNASRLMEACGLK